MDQGSPRENPKDNLVLRELDWDEADLDEELHKAGGCEQSHSFWVCMCTVKPSQLVYVAKLEEL